MKNTTKQNTNELHPVAALLLIFLLKILTMYIQNF